MFRMAVGHSDDIDVERALDAVIEECEAVLAGAVPSAGLLLASWDSDHQVLIDRIRGRYPGIQLAGAVVVGRDVVGPGLLRGLRRPRPVRLGHRRHRGGHGARRRARPGRGHPARRGRRALQVRPPAEPVHRDDDGRPGGGVDHPRTPCAPPSGRTCPILGGGAAPRDPADDPTARDRRGPGDRRATSSPTTRSRSCCSAGRSPCRTASTRGGAASGRRATVTGVSADSVIGDRRAARARVLRAVPRDGRRRRSPTPRRVRPARLGAASTCGPRSRTTRPPVA